MSFHRFAQIESRADVAGDSSSLTVELAFASEQPYERWWGVEILDCAPESVRLERLNDGAPLLFNHDWHDLRGTHEAGSARCDADRIARTKVRITAATQAGRDAIALVQDAVLTKVSVGYEIHRVIEQTTSKSGEKVSRDLDGALFGRILKRSEQSARGDLVAFRRALDAAAGAFERTADGATVYRVIDWEPLENSLVTVPADNSVGVGRAHDQAHSDPAPEPESADAGVTSARSESPAAPIETIPAQPAAQEKTMQAPEHNLADAQKRVADIIALGKQFERFGARDMADDALNSGETVEAFTARLMAKISEKTEQWKPELGLSEKETRSYSLFRAIDAQLNGNWKNAGFERECHDAILARCEAAGVPIKGGFFLPTEVRQLHAGKSLQKRLRAQRDMLVATASAGGYLVGTDHRADEFVDLLRADSLAGQLGVRFLSGLIGNFSAPKKTAGSTAYWLANETTGITESQMTLGQIVLSPKNVGGYTEISRQALLQTAPDAEALTIDDLRDTLALAIDAAVFNGTGANGQPLGILNTSGIGAVTGTSLAYAGIVEAQTDLASANALAAGCKYVGTPAVAGLLMQRNRVANTDTPLWAGNMLEGTVGGFPAIGSTQLPAATLLFGNFADVIVGEWGTLEIAIDPAANFPAGTIGVRAFATVDVGVRRASSFTAATSIT